MHFLVILLVSLASLAVSQTTRLPGRLDTLVQQGIDAVMMENFASADSIFGTVSREYADHPVGPVMQAALVHLVAEDQLASVDTRVIDSLHAEAEERGKAYSVEDPEGRVALAFVSSSRGVVSLEAAREGAWLKAISYALKAASLGEDILEQDSAMADAGLVVGNYYYWKSRRVEVLTWLPFVADSREEGLTRLRHSAEHGTYQRFAAMSSLAWILRDAGDGTEGIFWVERALSFYPTNRPLLRSYAALLQDAKKFAHARNVWKSIYGTLERDGLTDGWAAYEVLVMEASMSKHLGDSSAVNEALVKLADLEQTLDISRAGGRREQLVNMATVLRKSAGSGTGAEPPTAK